MVTKHTDSQHEVLQISSGLSFDTILDIGTIYLLVGFKHCGKANIFTPESTAHYCHPMAGLFTSALTSPLLYRTWSLCFNNLKCFHGWFAWATFKTCQKCSLQFTRVETPSVGCIHRKKNYIFIASTDKCTRRKGAVRCTPFLRCSALLLPIILIKVSSSVPNFPSPAANKS